MNIIMKPIINNTTPLKYCNIIFSINAADFPLRITVIINVINMPAKNINTVKAMSITNPTEISGTSDITIAINSTSSTIMNKLDKPKATNDNSCLLPLSFLKSIAATMGATYLNVDKKQSANAIIANSDGLYLGLYC